MSPGRKIAPVLTLRNNEFSGDMAAWAREHCENNEEQIERLCKNLRTARATALTARQQQVMQMYYDEGQTMDAIAKELHINRSTVSRHLSRGRERLRRCLRYTF